MDNVKITILNILKRDKSEASISEDTAINLFDLGIIDSFYILELVASLDDAFDIKIEGKDLIPENFETVDSIVNMICSYKNVDCKKK